MTPHSKYWNDFIKTDEYKRLSDAMIRSGMKQPYVNNIIYSAFYAGLDSGMDFYKPLIKWVIRNYSKVIKRADVSMWLKDWIKKQFGIK